MIRPAIVVVIEHRDAEGLRRGIAETGFLRDVFERTVAIVVKQAALAVSSDKKIVEAIVVVVADSHAHSIEVDVQARLVRHVGERAVVIAVIELRCRVLLYVAGPVHPIDKKNVRPAVIIVINEGDAGPHGAGKEFLAEGAIVVCEADTGLLCDVTELNGRGFRRVFDSGLRNDKYCQRDDENRTERTLHHASQSRPTPSASAALLM